MLLPESTIKSSPCLGSAGDRAALPLRMKPPWWWSSGKDKVEDWGLRIEVELISGGQRGEALAPAPAVDGRPSSPCFRIFRPKGGQTFSSRRRRLKGGSMVSDRWPWQLRRPKWHHPRRRRGATRPGAEDPITFLHPCSRSFLQSPGTCV